MKPSSARPFSVEICCPSLNRPKELARLHASLPPDCTFSPSVETQPRALPLIVNELFQRSTADIVIMAADHLEFRPACVDVVREGFAAKFPDLDGVMGLNICNLPRTVGVTEYSFIVVGRKFIERFYADGKFQGLFCPDYYHFYGDTEFGQFAEKIGKFYYDERAEVFTWHPNAKNASCDRTYSASRSRKAYDDGMWKRRREANLFWGESFVRIGAPAAVKPAAAPGQPATVVVDGNSRGGRLPRQLGRRQREKIAGLLRPGARILWWGAGEATVWLAQHLPAGARLTVVDHAAAHLEAAQAGIGTAANVRLLRREATGPVGAPGTIAEEDAQSLAAYVQATDGEFFDLIVATGPARGACLRRAGDLLAPGGVVVLADAQRAWYDAAKGAFRGHGHLGSCPDLPGAQLWWGGRDDVPEPREDAGPAPLIISFYTKNTDYEKEARKLIASCEWHGLEHRVVGLDSRGSWEANCSLKSEFVYETWKSTDRPVLWVDSDAILHRSPDLLRGCSADFGIHKCRGWEFASGTVFFNRTPSAGALLERWIARCRRFPQVWDQENLDLAWEDVTATHPLETIWLPEPYCRIFDLHEGRSAGAAAIEHFQASRRLKTKISNKPNTPAPQPTAALKAARQASRPRTWQLSAADGATIPDSAGGPGPAILERMADAFAALQPSPGKILCLEGGVGPLWRLLETRRYDVRGLASAADYVTDVRESLGDRIRVGMSQALPFSDGFFDGVVAFGVLELLDDATLPHALKELHRVVTGRSLVIVQTAPDPENRWPAPTRRREWWTARLREAGFEPLEGAARAAGGEWLAEDGNIVACAVAKKAAVTAAGKNPVGAAAPVSAEAMEFVASLTQFFEAPRLLHIEWKSAGVLDLTRHDGARVTVAERGVKIDPLSPRLPVPDGSVDTILNLGSFAGVDERALPAWLAELWRVAGRNLWFALEAAPGRDRKWWETRFFEAGFRKHAKLMEVVPYENLEQEGGTLLLLLEKIPAAGLARYPLAALAAERSRHVDMTRESGRRSEAHIARYILARQYLPADGLVLDAACGLGYGSAILAWGDPARRVVGLDNSEFAVAYGAATFAPAYPNVRFQVGDACDLSAFADASVGLVVAFEAVEHLREPEKFLREVRRVLKPGGNFVCSVPTLRVDEHGKDPNPEHFHVFDFRKIVDLCGQFLCVRDVFSQTAGGGKKLTNAPRRIRQVDPQKPGNEEAEWWLVAAGCPQPVAAPAPAPTPATVPVPVAAPLPVAAPMPAELPAGKIVVLANNAQHPLFTSWLGQCAHRVVYATDTGVAFPIPEDADLVVAADCYREPRVTLLCRAMERGIPTLVLADGVLEYRNTFEHPQIAPGAIFQPVLGHKVACLGRSQARVLESWGNAAQCEITGSARFDRYATLRRRSRPAGAPFRVLVTTAITPYFTPEQHELVLRSLVDLKNFFAKNRTLGGVTLQAAWRVTKGLQDEIGVDSSVADLTGRELAEELQTVDAVIGTPSTALVEAMLLGLPVAVLDYCNCPHYVQPAWRITAEEHIAPTVAELIAPPAPKLLFQDTVLHDTLECTTPAAPRLLRLADEMIARGRQARAAGVPLALPPRLLPLGPNDPAPDEPRSRADELFPDHAPFRERRLEVLQVEVGQLRTYVAELEHRSMQSVDAGELAKVTVRAGFTLRWRSKLEAAAVLSGLKQPKAALNLILQGLKAVEECREPEAILEALLEISPELGRLDAARARTLLDTALKLAQRMDRPEAVRRAAQILEQLPRVANPAASAPGARKAARAA